MISFKAPELLPKIADALPAGHGLPLCANGQQAARSIVELMDKAAAVLDPLTIIESYEKAGAGTRQATLNAMWDDLGDHTVAVMAQGAIYLAMLWESAWTAGNGDAIPKAKLHALDPDNVRDRYIDPAFLPSLTLDTIGSEL